MKQGNGRFSWLLSPFAVLAVLLLALPFAWMVLAAFKTPQELAAYPPSLLPANLSLSNFIEVWQTASFTTLYRNSLVTGIASTALTLYVTACIAYACAWIPFRGRTVLLAALVGTMLIPDEMKLIPNYLLTARLGWIDSYWGLIIPPAANAFPLFVFYQYFRSLPRDLLEAAEIDGAGHFRTLWSVVLPVARPTIAAVALVTFLGRWNDYLWPLVMVQSPSMRTVPLGLAYFQQVGEGSAPWHLLMAAACLAVVPLILLYGFVQRQFVAGLTQGALKG